MTKTSAARWQRRAKAFVKQGPAFETYIVRAPNLLLGVLEGDAKSLRFAESIAQFVKELLTKPPLCMTCEHRFSSISLPLAFVFLVPFGRRWEVDEASAMVSGICKTCASDTDDEIAAKALKLWGSAPMALGHA